MAHESTGGSQNQAESPIQMTSSGHRRVWLWSSVIAVGGFLFGFDTGVISGALLYIKTDFHMSSFEQSSTVSVLLIGAMIGALGYGRIADPLGRRKTFGLVGLVFLIGTAIVTLSVGYPMLLAGRLVLGLAVGSGSAIVPTYLGELAPAQIRGRVLTLNQLMITIGIMIAYLVNVAFSTIQSWRGMFAVGAIPSLVMIFGALFLLPESPAWLLTNQKMDELQKIYRRMLGETDGDRLIQQRQQERQAHERQGDNQQQVGWRGLFSHAVIPALVVGVVLAALQQFGGINTIIYYAPTIMERSGLSASNSITYSVAIGAINLIMTIVSIWVVGRVGRRSLLLFSVAAMLVTMALTGAAFFIGVSSGVSLIFMVLYIAGFAVGMGPLFWVLIGEIFPPHAAAAGSSSATAVNWASNFVVSLVFLLVVDAIGLGGTFWAFAVICAIALWFIAKYVPETKDRDFPDIDADIQARFGRSGEEASQSR